MSDLPASVTHSSEGLPSVTVCNRHARARIYLQGAHIAAFRPVGHGELLWMSVRSHFSAGKPIRGGIPLCFPWFGPHPERADLPAHGFARLLPFTLADARDLDDGRTQLTFTLRDSETTRTSWPHRFALDHIVTVGPTLQATLEVRNEGDAPFSFEEALHTYFDVSDVRTIEVHGLHGVSYLDKVAAGVSIKQAGAVAFTGETDRVYTGTTAPCTIVDPKLARQIVVTKQGSYTTVVWNPWIAKAARMPDFGDDEWPGMVCVESANTAADRINLAAGESHRLQVEISGQS